MKTVSIHQMEHLVWLGNLDKISKSNILILADDFQYKKNYVENRNKIRTKDGWTWVTVPIKGSTHLPMNQILIDNSQNWKREYLNTIRQSYSKANNFELYYPRLESIINQKWEYLINLNQMLLYWMLDEFDINTGIDFSSRYKLINNLGSERLLELCQNTQADTYLSGSSGKDYLNVDIFHENGIGVKYHEFFQPAYKQTYSGFEYGMSALDYLMNMGNKVWGKGNESLYQIQHETCWSFGSKVLEMFGGDGMGHCQLYANKATNVEMWELDNTNCIRLATRYQDAYVKNVNSLKELKTTTSKFDIIIVDAPATLSIKPILEDLYRLVDKKATIIIRLIKQSYNNNPDVDLTWIDENTILPNLKIVDYKLYDREAYFNTPWLYNCVLEVEKL